MEQRNCICVENGGILLVNKPAGCTSHDVVNKIRKLFQTKKVGHTGTLDPMATGVLAILVGRAVKASEYLLAGEKTYVAGIRLGTVTDTQDTTGAVLSTSDKYPCAEEFLACIKKFEGDILQTPPMYSALKVGGKKLCDLAREGKSVDLEPRSICIKYIKVNSFDTQNASFETRVSHGTYIRTLCHDIGASLGCGAAMSSLHRISVDKFTIEDCVTLEELESMSEDTRIQRLIPVESAFEQYPAITLPAFYERLFQNGNEIYQKKIGTSFAVGQKLRILVNGSFFALAQVREFGDQTAICSIKRF